MELQHIMLVRRYQAKVNVFRGVHHDDQLRKNRRSNVDEQRVEVAAVSR